MKLTDRGKAVFKKGLKDSTNKTDDTKKAGDTKKKSEKNSKDNNEK